MAESQARPLRPEKEPPWKKDEHSGRIYQILYIKGKNFLVLIARVFSH
jgi:hypothetical protein